MKKLILASVVSTFILAGCGGGGSEGDCGDCNAPDPTPTTTITGKVIDGYVSGATVFLDLNANSELDSGEPSTVTQAAGAYSLDLNSDQDACVGYVPIVTHVPVGAIDSDYGEVTEAYTMVTPPTFERDEPQNVTPLTTMVWQEAISGLEMDHSQAYANGGCQEIAQNEELYNELSTQLDASVIEFQRAYNMTEEEIFSDYVARGDVEAHALAAAAVEGFQRAYAERAVMIEEGKHVWAHMYTYVEQANANTRNANPYSWKLHTGYSEDLSADSARTYSEITLVDDLDAPINTYVIFATDVLDDKVTLETYDRVAVSTGFIIDDNVCKGSVGFDAHDKRGEATYYRRMATGHLVDSVQACADSYDTTLTNDSIEQSSNLEYFYMGSEIGGSPAMAYDIYDVDGIIGELDNWYIGYYQVDTEMPFADWWRKGVRLPENDLMTEHTRDIDGYEETTIWYNDGTYERTCFVDSVPTTCK
ncbi:hypothetical protein VPHK567_0304 [Vibrio phage K567]